MFIYGYVSRQLSFVQHENIQITGLKVDMILYRGLSGGKLPDRMFTPDERGRLGVRPCLSWRVLGMANYKSHTTVSRNGNSVDLVDCFHRDGRIWCLVDDLLEVALDYSGVRNGQTATVLAVRVSQVDSGACLIDFSQVLPLLLLFRLKGFMSARVSLRSQMAQILSDFNDDRMCKFDDPRSTLNPH